MSKPFSPAPLTSPVITKDNSVFMFFRNLNDHLYNATSTKSVIDIPTNNQLNYSTNGTMITFNYNGQGGLTMNLPAPPKYNSFVNVSDGSNIMINAGDKTITIPTYKSIVIIQGHYLS
jgi:hypothetical protein